MALNTYDCPMCGKSYIDRKDWYLKRINENQKHYTDIRCCECLYIFRLRLDNRGGMYAVLNEKDKICNLTK